MLFAEVNHHTAIRTIGSARAKKTVRAQRRTGFISAPDVRAVDEVLADTSRSYRVTGLARLRHLVLPSASPQVIAGMRQALSISIILMVISELFGSTNGLGFSIVQFQRSFAIAPMWTGIILLGLIGVVLSLLFEFFERHALRWYLGLRRSQRGG